MSSTQRTSVVIVGGGASGLTLASFLQSANVRCVVLERRHRTYMEARQRAGVVDGRGVAMFERWGLADKLLAGPVAASIDYRINGESRIFEIESSAGQSRFCTQQMLVNNLLKLFIDDMGGNIRFGADNIEVRNESGTAPRISYTDDSGAHVLDCDYIVGCDGSHSVCRSSIPHGILTKYSHEFGYAWLAALVETPVAEHPIMGVSDRGFIGQLPRGPKMSRFYLQCAVSDGPEDWSDERIWDEIRLRFNDPELNNAPVLSKEIVPLRSVLFVPMQYNNMFLAGDAAHLVPPTGAKGMNLALFDVDILAQAFVLAFRNGDTTALESYSDSVLPHLWRYQEYSAWMTDTMHDAGDASLHGTFRQMTARARLETILHAPAAARVHGDYQNGVL